VQSLFDGRLPVAESRAMLQTLRRLAVPLTLVAVVSVAAPLPAQPPPERVPPREAAVAAAGDRLPAAVTTLHPLALPGGPIAPIER